MIELEQKIAQYFAKKDGVVAVFLYGSFAKGRQNSNSDVDIAVLCSKNGNRRTLFQLELEYFKELSRIVRHNLDIVILNRAGELLCHEIFREGKVIYERDRSKRIEFQARRTVDYLDFAPLMELMSRGMMSKLAKHQRND